MKIIIGADHAGVTTKDSLAAQLRFWDHEVSDVGTHGDDSVDYPDFAHQVAQAVAAGKADRGVLVCGSGVGMAIAANRHAGVRAVVIRDPFDAQMSRAHNNSNIACFGARVTELDVCVALLKQWLETDFVGDRHERRVGKIEL